jgi:hypothetical protein
MYHRECERKEISSTSLCGATTTTTAQEHQSSALSFSVIAILEFPHQ